jgi:transcriptional regulator with XRE-family HTH domain
MKKRPESKGIEEIIAGRIHDARARRGFTLAQISKQTGISVAMLSKIENAKVSSPISVYAKIAKTLEIRLGELFYRR